MQDVYVRKPGKNKSNEKVLYTSDCHWEFSPARAGRTGVTQISIGKLDTSEMTKKRGTLWYDDLPGNYAVLPSKSSGSVTASCAAMT